VVIRLYETSDGEVFTKWVEVDKPVASSKYVTSPVTKNIEAEKVILKPVRTIVLTRYKYITKQIIVTIPKFIFNTKIIRTIVSRVRGAPWKVGQELDNLRGTGGGFIKPTPRPARRVLHVAT